MDTDEELESGYGPTTPDGDNLLNDFARGESTDNREVFVITLQKDRSVAVCYMAAVNWINLSSVALDDPKRCDVR